MIRKKSQEVKKDLPANTINNASDVLSNATPKSVTRDYSITVDGRIYQVQVSPGGTVSAAPAPENIPISSPPASAVSSIDIPAPTPGNIVRVEVAVGENIVKDQVLLVMEAMKMESEVKSSQSGIVQTIHVQPGDTVKAGDVLIILGE